MPISVPISRFSALVSCDQEDLGCHGAYDQNTEADSRSINRGIVKGESLQAATMDLCMSSLVILILGKNWSDWQQFELDFAIRSKIPIAGVLVYGQFSDKQLHIQSLDIPLALNQVALVGLLNHHFQVLDYEHQFVGDSTSSIIEMDFKLVAASLTREIAKNPHKLYSLSPRRFEELVAYLMEKSGYEVTLTQQSRDGGIDIFALKKSGFGEILTIVDCKKYAPDRPVGVELVRTMYGTLAIEKASHAIVATTSRFTADAKELANSYRYQISLKDHSDILMWANELKRQRQKF